MNRPEDNVIVRFLSGECSDEEMQQVRDWVSESSQNADELFELEQTYQRLRGLSMSGREVEKALDAVHAALDKRSQRHVVLARLMRYAAAVVVVAVMGASIWLLGGGFDKLGATGYLVAKATMEAPREVTLSDSTRVWLNAGSSLKYPQEFGRNERRVELQGEGYFEVAKDESKPFVVSGGAVEVKVLGTVFDFNVSSDRSMAEVSLIEGSVEVTERHSAGRVMLLPGQKACVDCETGRILVKNANVRLDAVWHDRLIPFCNSSVQQIANTLEQLYGVDIVVDAGIDSKRTYSGQILHKNDIDSVLRLLENTLPVRSRRHEGKIYLHPNY